MISKLLGIILLAGIISAVELGLDIFHMQNAFKQLVDRMESVKLESNAATKTEWIKQPLDHFNAKEKTFWKMRYFENLEFWKTDGPIYIFLGGEAEASDIFLKTGIMYDLAKETNGGMYASEHRYYGESIPVSGTTADDLKFLTARQALADVANLIRSIKSIYSKSKIVVVGGSYSGNLAAWMRKLYPDLVDAAIASSAPVLAKKDFYEYLERVRYDFELFGGHDCIKKIENTFERYEKLLETPDGTEQLKQEMNICPQANMSITENKQYFFSCMIEPFESVSQYGPETYITKYCSKLDITTLWNAKKPCFDCRFDKLILYLQTDVFKPWIYQTCSEFGYYQTTTSNSQPFTKNVPLDFSIKVCVALFGKDFNEERVDKGVEQVNNLYGGLSPNVTQVVFSNGDVDPWSRLGILKSLSEEAPAVVIPNSTHCLDLFSDENGDPVELKEARKNIKNFIKKWINNNNK